MIGIIVLMTAMVALCGAILAVTPYLVPATECFAVTVPPSARRDPRIQALTRRYARGVLAATGISAIATAFAMVRLDAFVSGIVMSVALAATLTIAFVLMLQTRSHVQALKEREGWCAVAQRTAAIVGEEDIPRPVPMAWELLHLAIVAVFVVAAFATYDRLPEMVPIQTELDGTVSEWTHKSVGVALYPALLATFIGVVLATTHAMILRSKRPIDPAAPATSAYAYGRFARLQSFVLLVGGLVLNASIGALFFASALGAISTGESAILVVAVAIGFVVVELWAAVYQGQSGARLADELRATDELARDDDAYWKLGSIYCNPNDPAIVVPKRFGVGWTVNCARPQAWALAGGLVALTLAFCLLLERVVG